VALSSDSIKVPDPLIAALSQALAANDAETVSVPRPVLRQTLRELRRLLMGLWDAKDVARFLGVHRNWVYQQAEAGQLPCVRIGGNLRFDPDTIRSIAKGQPIRGTRVVALPVAPRKDRTNEGE
jgi:excisionase family DNA binding protein